MPNTREKLIELLQSSPTDIMGNHGVGALADHLIANGVTIATDNSKWTPVTERLPENDYGKHWKERPHYLVCLSNGLMMVATFGFKEYGWWIDSHSCVLAKEHYREVTHWMPLPEPPKGE